MSPSEFVPKWFRDKPFDQDEEPPFMGVPDPDSVSRIERDPVADQVVCDAASPGPWGAPGSSKHIRRVDAEGKPLPRTGQRPCGDTFPLVGMMHTFQDVDFVVLAREALPYWIELARTERERAEKAEAENLEWLRLARRLKNATTEEEEREAYTDLSEMCLGNGYLDTPEPVVKMLLERAEKAEAELARLRQLEGEQHVER